MREAGKPDGLLRTRRPRDLARAVGASRTAGLPFMAAGAFHRPLQSYTYAWFAS